VKYSFGVQIEANDTACDTGGASTASSSICSEIVYSPTFAEQFSCTAVVNARVGSFLPSTKEVGFQPFAYH